MPKAGFWAIESHTIRFGKDGHWYSDDEPIVNRRIADLFSKHITRGSDGDWWLVVGDERARIEVEDTPFVIIRVDGDRDGFTVGLNDGTVEPLATDRLQISAEDVLYCEVKGGSHRARFLRPAQAELLQHVEMEGDRFVLPMAAGRHAIGVVPEGAVP